MTKTVFTTIFLVFLLQMISPGSAFAQFGRNKVDYEKIDWYYLRTDNFDIYHPKDRYELAEFTANVAEESLKEIERSWNYSLHSRITIIVYPNHNMFQNTNVSGGTQGESTGGFTEFLKNRVVIPFEGSYDNFRHVIHHELTHACMLRFLFGEGVQSIISGISRLPIPLWFIEGLAEYESNRGWTNEADMYMRDAVINDYLPPLEGLSGYFYYKGGQSLLYFLDQRYGSNKVGEILRQVRSSRDLNRAVKISLGFDLKELSKRWQKWVKREIWPTSADYESPEDFATRISDHEKWYNFVNTSPAISPDGDKLVFLSDKDDYTSIYIMSTVSGKIERKLVTGGRVYLFEKLLWLRPWIDWSPDSKNLVFVGEKDGEDVIYIMDIDEVKITQTISFGLDAVSSPVWSPDGKSIVFSGQHKNRTDLFIFDVADPNNSLYQLTDDIFSDYDPDWSPDGNQILFISDRGDYVSEPGEGFEMWNHSILQNDVYTISVHDKKIQRITNDEYYDRTPSWTPRENTISYVSDRNGVPNLYLHNLEKDESWAVSNVITGVFTPSWSNSGTVAFASFYDAGYDIYLYKNPFDASRHLNPELTGFQQKKRTRNEDLQTADADFEVDNPVRIEHIEIPRLYGDPIKTTVGDAETINHVKPDSMVTVVDPEVTTEENIDKEESENEVLIISEPENKKEDKSKSEEKEKQGAGQGVRLIPDPYPVKTTQNADNPYKNYIFKPPELADEDFRESPKALRKMEESEPLVDEDGNFIPRKYRTKFSADVVNTTAGYSTFFGFQGNGQIMFSDVLGNQVIYLGIDMYYSLENSNFALYYYHLPGRTDIGGGIFHNVYYFDNIKDRNYGASVMAQYPISRNRRVETTMSFINIDREIWSYDAYDYVDGPQSHFVLPSVAYIYDNTLWGYTGPINGHRYRVSFSYSPDLDSFDPDASYFVDPSQYLEKDLWGIDFKTLAADARKYFHVGLDYSFAHRMAGATSWGENPMKFFLGGVSNWVNRRFKDGDIRDSVDEVYFSSFALPVRGADFYEKDGNTYLMFNNEFRFPLVRHMLFGWPLPLFLYNVRGAIFYDIGAAWDYSDFRFTRIDSAGDRRFRDVASGFGWGWRINMGYFMLKWDMAWGNDYHGWSKPVYYWSLGTDF